MKNRRRTEQAKPKGIPKKKEAATGSQLDPQASLALVALSLFLFVPLLLNPALNADDAAQHYWWSSEFVKELASGNLYPRWLSGAYGGRGSPVMFYYPPVPFYAVSLFYVFAREPLTALYWGCWLGMAVSGLTMFLFSRTLLPRRESFIAAALYMTAHYHLFDFYQRLAQHEYWAFAWVPLLLYGISRIQAEDSARAVPVVALGYALLLMTHLPTSLIVTALLPVYAVFVTRDLRRLARIAFGLVLGAGIAAIYLTPYLFEGDYLKSLGQKAPNQYYHAGFLFENLGQAARQIPFPSSGNFEMFLLAGDWMAVAFLALLVTCTVILWKSDFRQNNVVRGLWAVTTISLLMTTRLTTPVWRFVPKFRAIQFPIRWFSVVTLGLSVLAAIAVSLALRRPRPPYLQPAILAAVLLFNLVVSWLVVTRAPFQPEALARRLTTYTDVREYHPRWWDQQRHTELDEAPAVVTRGKANVTAIDEQGTEQGYRVNAEEESVVKFRTLYFPGWQARLDGQLATLSPNDEGHMQVTIAPGEHDLSLMLESTPPRTAGKIVSSLSLLAFAVVIFLTRRKTTAAAVAEAPQTVKAGKR